MRYLISCSLLSFSGWVFASPAEAFFASVHQELQQHYYGYDSARLSSLLNQYENKLHDTCVNNSDCLLENGLDALWGVLGDLNDGHTQYFTHEDYAQKIARHSGSLARLSDPGIRVIQPSNMPGYLVLTVRSGSPADQAGLQRGDVIMGMQGKAMPLLNGGNNIITTQFSQSETPFALTVRRGINVFETRIEHMPNQAVLPKLITDNLPYGVGILQINDFETYRQVSQEVHNLVARAKQKNLQALVIDLRYNSGGLLAEWVAAFGAFLPKVEMISQYKDHQAVYTYEKGKLIYTTPEGTELLNIIEEPQLWTKPVIVLVNQHTKSSGEYFAEAMQYYQRGLVVGENTWGALQTSANFFPLSKGKNGALSITTARSVHPDGTPYPERVTPDTTVLENFELLPQGNDAMLNTAFTYLNAHQAAYTTDTKTP